MNQSADWILNLFLFCVQNIVKDILTAAFVGEWRLQIDN